MKKHAYVLCTMSLFQLSYLQTTAHVEQTKSKSITTKSESKNMIDTGHLLDLSTFTKSDSGISHNITTTGTGPKPYPGEIVTVHYTGWLLDGNNKVGKKFDSSKDRNQHFKFQLGQGQVIKGWDLSLAEMQIGEKRIVILPAHLAYGSRGAGSVIPPNATLIFEIELFEAS